MASVGEHAFAVPQDTGKPNSESSQQTGEAETTKDKKGSKVSRTLKKAIPDCINIIFGTCKDNSGRNQEIADKQERELARAAERCRELIVARPQPSPSKPATEPHGVEVPEGESSSRTSEAPREGMPYCTPEHVLAAEHDVEVGDFNFKDKNYKGAEMRYRSALERLPGEPIATLHLARVLEKQGKTAEAYEQYKSYMGWSPTGKDAEEAQAAIQRLERKISQK